MRQNTAMLYNIILQSISVRPTFWQPFIVLLTYIVHKYVDKNIQLYPRKNFFSVNGKPKLVFGLITGFETEI